MVQQSLLRYADDSTEETLIEWRPMDMSLRAMAERKEIERKYQNGVFIDRLLQRD